MAYSFAITKLHIDSIRSAHRDTLYICSSVAVAGRPPHTSTRGPYDDVGVEKMDPRFLLPDVPIADHETAVFSYLVVNNGHSQGREVLATMQDKLAKLASTGAEAASAELGVEAGAAAAAAIGGLIGTPVPVVGTAIGIAVGALAGWLSNTVIRFFDANCDGPVASGAHVFKGAELRDILSRGGLVHGLDNNPGSGSPIGCGSNSYYHTEWNVTIGH